MMEHLTIPDDKSYTGYDVVRSVIDANILKHKKSNIKFEFINSIDDIKSVCADLFIIKDVMIHWPNDKIVYFLKNILPNYKYALIVNDYTTDCYNDGDRCNKDIKLGEFRPVDVKSSPFNLDNVELILEYNNAGGYKKVYLYTNDKK